MAVTEKGGYLASDVLALLAHTRDVVYLEDGDIAEVGLGQLRIIGLDGQSIEREVRHIDWDPEEVGKGAYPHYMLKEIHEQPDVLARTAFGRINEEAGDVDLEGWSDEAIADAGSEIRALIRTAFLGLIALFVVVFGVPFYLGMLVGRVAKRPS